MSFQTAVNAVPAPGIAGDFASTNPRHSVLGGPTGIVAGPNGSGKTSLLRSMAEKNLVIGE